MSALVGALGREGSSVFYHPTHLFFIQGCFGEDGVGALTELQLQVSMRAVLDLLFAELFYPSKLWEIGKNPKLRMAVLPVGFI